MSPLVCDVTVQELPALVGIGLLVAPAGCLGMWAWILWRLGQRAPVLPFEPRRRVPWGGLHVFGVLVVYVGAALLLQPLGHALAALVGEEPASASALEGGVPDAPGAEESKPRREHPVLRALERDSRLGMILLAVYSAVVVAPVVEEFFFRLLLQGWLEKLEWLGRRRWLALRRLIPGVLPVLVASALFAAIHVRTPKPDEEPRPWLSLMAADATARLVTVALFVWLLRALSGATARDLGFVREKFWADVRLGLLAFLAIGIPIYLIQEGFARLLPKSVVPDPIALVFFASALGLLYYRTHRIVPAVTLHLALNATSVTIYVLTRSS